MLCIVGKGYVFLTVTTGTATIRGRTRMTANTCHRYSFLPFVYILRWKGYTPPRQKPRTTEKAKKPAKQNAPNNAKSAAKSHALRLLAAADGAYENRTRIICMPCKRNPIILRPRVQFLNLNNKFCINYTMPLNE